MKDALTDSSSVCKFGISFEGTLTAFRLDETMAIASATDRCVVIDMSRVNNQDSEFMQLVIAAKLEAIARGLQVEFIGIDFAQRGVSLQHCVEECNKELTMNAWILCNGKSSELNVREGICHAVLSSKYRRKLCKDVKGCNKASA